MLTPRRRSPRPHRAGASLFEALLALLVILPLIQISANLIARYVDDQSSALEVAHLSRIANSTAAALLPNLPNILRNFQPVGTARVYGQLQLRNIGAITDDETLITALGRQIEVYTLSDQQDHLVILVRAATQAGQAQRVKPPVIGGAGDWVGYINPAAGNGANFIQGPGVNFNLAGMRAAGHIFTAGDVIALKRIRFDADIRPYLHRRSVPSAPELTTMTTDLVMNGASITGAGDISAQTITVGQTLRTSVLDVPSTITGDITFNGSLTINGFTQANNLSTSILIVSSRILSPTLTELANLKATRAEIYSNTSAQNITVSNTLSATSFTASTANFQSLTAQNANIGQITAAATEVIDLSAQTITTTGTLTIEGGGGCQGC